jgi:adenylate cyclase
MCDRHACGVTDGEVDTGAADVVNAIQRLLLGGDPMMNVLDVAAQADIAPSVARELWRLLGFPLVPDPTVAFTGSDVEAARVVMELMQLGVVSPESQAALVRTLARSSARLAEWQTRLLSEAGEGISDTEFVTLIGEVLPRIEKLQTYIWRRHLAGASAALLITEDVASAGTQLAVCFVDIVGYTSRSKELDEAEFVDWIEHFEAEVTSTVVDHGGQVVKTMGDEALFVIEDPLKAAEVGLVLTARGSDDDDRFPAVRVGIAYGSVVHRLGDVFGTTVNIAARLTSIGRPGTVIGDQGVHDLLCADHAPAETHAVDLAFRRLRRRPIKGFSKLDGWAIRRPRGWAAPGR